MVSINSPSSKITIVLASNQNYVKLLVPCITSILYNKKPTTAIDIFILDGGISEFDKQKIIALANEVSCKQKFNHTNNCTISFVSQDKQLNNLTLTEEAAKRYSLVSFYRLNIPKLFSHLERVLYLDVDTIVRTDLLDFFNQDFANNYCICRKDVRFVKEDQLLDNLSANLIEYNNKVYLYQDFLLELGLSKNALDKQGVISINAGVLLFNIKQILADSKDKVLIDYAVKHAKYLTMLDQDIIRIVFQDKIKFVDRQYNYFIFSYNWFINLNYKERKKQKVALENAVIYHYTVFKPTRFNRLYKMIPFACNEFFKYSQMSYLRKNPIKLWVTLFLASINRLRRRIIGIKVELGHKKIFYLWRFEFVIKKAKYGKDYF